MKRIVLLIITLMSGGCLCAQTAESLNKSFEKARMELDAARKAFADSADASLASYLEYEAKLFEKYEQFRIEMMETWGDSVMVESTRKAWVEYSGDRTSRTSVNWESGDVTVEVLVDPNDDDAAVKSKLQKAVGDLLSNKGNTYGFNSESPFGKTVSDRPLLEGQIDLTPYGVASLPVSQAPKPFEKKSASKPAPSRGGRLNLLNGRSSAAAEKSGKTMVDYAAELKKEEVNSDTLAKQQAEEQQVLAKLPEIIVESQTPQVQSVATSEGVKNVVKITMKLVEDHIPKRAEKFKTMISKHAGVYSVEEPLVYAIMEQESAFNPMAQSWVPAYGLMQLVPKSGGRDAYRYVYKKDGIPTADFLFEPENNIQLGTGYLKLLMSTTFKKIEDPRCRMLCTIAAYNTGAGNVSRAINGTTNISKAIPLINKMSYDQLFEHLKRSLPHAETKDYIQKVTTKMQKYMK